MTDENIETAAQADPGYPKPSDEEPDRFRPGWTKSSVQMPQHLETVIGLYTGDWPGRGVSGITDVYAYDGEWFNLPEGVEIVGWMPVPDTAGIVPEPVPQSLAQTSEFLGTVEIEGEAFVECVFKGDFSPFDSRSSDAGTER